MTSEQRIGAVDATSSGVLDGIVRQIFSGIDEYFRAGTHPAFRPGQDPVSVGYACFDAAEVKHVLHALLSGWISMGSEAAEFERRFARYVGRRAGIAVNSGSSANLVALATLIESGRARPGDEVILPAATFSTVLSPVIQLGLRPVIVDVEPDTYNISAAQVGEALRPGSRIVMVVHTLGLPADMAAIQNVTRGRDVVMFEDCCEAHGTRYDGKVVGSFGDIATTSFFVAHNMTTGEGGMVMTDDPVLEEIARSLREFGRLRAFSKERFTYNDGVMVDYDERYIFQRLGYNFRLTDIAASFGLEQLAKLDGLNSKRIANAAYYGERLHRYEEFLQLPTVPANTVHTYYAYPIVVRPGSPFTRSELARFLESRHVEVRPLFAGNLPDQPAYRDLPLRIVGDLPVSKHLRDDLLFIGCHPMIGPAHREYACDVFDEFFASQRSARPT